MRKVSDGDWRKHQGVLLLLLFLVFCLYFPTLFHYAFADDEIYLAYSNVFLREAPWSDLYQLFLKPANPWEFLPFRDFTYWLDFRIYGDELTGFHASNLAWYVACCLAVFFLCSEFILFCRPDYLSIATVLALCGTLVFTVHPAHVEVVAWIASRKDLLAGTFAFFSIALLLRAIRRAWSVREMMLAALFLLMACFSKASAITNIFSIIVILSATPRREHEISPQEKLNYLFLFVTVAIVAVITHMSIGETTGIRIENQPGVFMMVDRASRILTALIGILLFPHPLRFYYDIYQLGDWHWLVSAGSVLLFILSVIVFIRKRSLWAAGVILSISPLFIYLQLLPFTTWSLASERFVFAATAGIGLIVIDLIIRSLQPTRPMIVLTAITLACSVLIWLRVAEWEDSRSMLAREYERQPLFHNAVRDQITYKLLPEKRYLEAEALARELPRPYAVNAMLALIKTQNIYQRMSDAKYAQKKDFDANVFRVEFCSAVSDLRSVVEIGYVEMRTERDVSYNNILRTLEQWLKFQFGDSKWLCQSVR